MKNHSIVMLLLLLLIIVMTGCSKKDKALIETHLISSEIDKVVVVTSMGNPKYGADSKTIMNSEEIEQFVETFNSAKIGKRVKDADVGVAMPSHYYFYSKGEVISKFTFNGDNSHIIWFNDSYHYVEYDDKVKRPYELYQDSTAQIEVVDEKGNRMKRPID